MQYLTRFLLVLSFLLLPSIGFAGYPPPVTEIKIQQADTSPDVYSAYQGCLKAVQEGNLKCSKVVGEIDALQTLSASQENQLLQMRTEGNSPGMKEIGEAFTSNLNKKKTALASVQGLCKPAAVKCENACEIIAACSAATNDAQKSAGNKVACDSAEKMREQCKISFEGASQMAAADMAGNNAALAQARDVSNRVTGSGNPPAAEEQSWMQRNGAYVVGAGMLGVGAMALLTNSGSKSNSQQQQQNSSPSPSPSPTATPATCSSDSDYNNSACTDTLVTTCTTSNTGSLCAAFSNYHCGLDDASDVTPSGSGAGNKTTFCRQIVSARFCASSGNNTCASCEYLTEQSKAICKTNPTLCVAQNSQAQIDAKQAACPSDPVYADNSILQGFGGQVDGTLDEPTLPTGTTSTLVGTNPTTTTPTSTSTGVFTGQYFSSNSKTKSTVTAASTGSTSNSANNNRKPAGSSASLAGGQGAYATASLYKGAASEVSDSLGRNLFDKNSKTISIWCKSVECRNIGNATAN